MSNKLDLTAKKLPYGANEIFYIVIILGFLLSGLSSYLIYKGNGVRTEYSPPVENNASE
jgi:hypothetical protein